MAYYRKTRSTRSPRKSTARSTRRTNRSSYKRRANSTRRRSGGTQTVRLVIEQVAATPPTLDGAFAKTTTGNKKSPF